MLPTGPTRSKTNAGTDIIGSIVTQICGTRFTDADRVHSGKDRIGHPMNWKKIASQMFAATAVLAVSATASMAQLFDYSTVFTPDPILVGAGPEFHIDITAGSNANVVAPSTITLANLELIDIPPAAPDGTYLFSQAFTIDLTIDPVSPAAGPLTKQVTGTLSGSVTILAPGSGTFNSVVFTAPPPDLVFDFGLAGTYIVNNPRYTSFEPLGATTKGAIAVDVSYVPAVPEPGEYAVMGLAGLTVCGLMVRARRRRSVSGMAS
jgi:hypothetical protein